MDGKFGVYDVEKLKEARAILEMIYEYNFGAASMNKLWKRLETIIRKLDELIEINRTDE